MRRLSDMEVFVQIVRHGSISATARTYNVTPAAVSYRLSKLESELGTRLLHRTTRQLNITKDGQEYLEHAQKVVRKIEQIDAEISKRNDEPFGTLSITMPTSFGLQHIIPVMPRFLVKYPQLKLNIVMSDEMLNIIEEGFDVAVRIGELQDSNLIARRLAPNHRVVCASPDYLNKHGRPSKPDELKDHNCLILAQQPYWSFSTPTGDEKIKITGNFICNNGTAIREAAYAGLGIALKATWDVAGAIKTGKLETILDDYLIDSNSFIWAVYPSRRNTPAKVRAFINFLQEHFISQPHWNTV